MSGFLLSPWFKAWWLRLLLPTGAGGESRSIMPISHMMRRQKLREVKDLAQGHTAHEECSDN